MPAYILSKSAEQDLREIARYTLKKWGKTQLNSYRQMLKNSFEAIAAGDVVQRRFSENLPDVHITKAGAHFIFYLTPPNSKPIVIAVLHEARDIVQHLASRLDDESS